MKYSQEFLNRIQNGISQYEAYSPAYEDNNDMYFFKEQCQYQIAQLEQRLNDNQLQEDDIKLGNGDLLFEDWIFNKVGNIPKEEIIKERYE